MRRKSAKKAPTEAREHDAVITGRITGLERMFLPADSPRFPKNAMINEPLLHHRPAAEAGSPWRTHWDPLAIGSKRDRQVALLGRTLAFLNFTEDHVRDYGRTWCAERDDEIAVTGRNPERPLLGGPDFVANWLVGLWSAAREVLQRTDEIAEHQALRRQLETERDPARKDRIIRYLALQEEPTAESRVRDLMWAEAALYNWTTATESRRMSGLQVLVEIAADLVSDWGMAVLVSRGVVPAVLKQKVFACKECAHAWPRRRKDQRYCPPSSGNRCRQQASARRRAVP